MMFFKCLVSFVVQIEEGYFRAQSRPRRCPEAVQQICETSKCGCRFIYVHVCMHLPANVLPVMCPGFEEWWLYKWVLNFQNL